MERTGTVVVGAGVVGLAIARALAASGREVLVLDRERQFGTGTSSRSSEVIHAGLYYPPGSLKARLCVDGAQRLYSYCRERHVPHRRCGKLIVATDAGQFSSLQAVADRAAACGVVDLRWIEHPEVIAVEPQLRAEAALLSPNTGIVDSHALMQALLADAEAHGAVFAGASEVVGIEHTAGGYVLRIGGPDGGFRLQAQELVNAAGLGAQQLASRIEGLPEETVPPLYLAKGNYFTLAGRVPFSRLIYPLPDEAGLGVHLTLDLAGQARFGPDVEWVPALDYSVDPRRTPAFEEQVRRFWRSLPPRSLLPGYAGIRPKLVGPGEAAADFRIDGSARHGLPGLVNLFGIESPGLTASLAIAQQVLAVLEGSADPGVGTIAA